MDTVSEINAWMEQGKALMQRLQAEQAGEAVPSAEGEASGDQAEQAMPEAENFSTPALVSNAPAPVPTIEPVDESDVPDEAKG